MLNRKITTAICLSTVGIAISAAPSFADGKEGIITASALNIRSGASTSHSIITKAYKGSKVEILESSNGWYRVKLSNGKIGWGSGSYISITNSNNSSSTNNSNTSSEKTGTVTASVLNIRSGAGTNYSVVTKASKGSKVEILESSNGWYRVKLSNGKIGWGSGSYISITNSNNSSSTDNSNTSSESSGKIGTVTASALNIRSGAGTNYSVVTKASKGSKVEILESSNGWYKVKLSNGKIGWGSGSYITIATSDSSSSNSNSENTTTSQNKAETVVNLAHAQLGKPYVWGAEGPNSFDCSGLIHYVYKQAGISMPRSSKEQANVGTKVSKSNLQPGDLIFSSTDGTGGVSHVSIYVGNGQMIHSPRTGKNVCKVSINNSYWSKAYLYAKRVL